MCGYWVQIANGDRVFESTLKDAYSTAAKTLLGAYRFTNGNIHKSIKGYHGSTGIAIYSTRTGKTFDHGVRFANGSNPKDGYEMWSYSKAYGVKSTAKDFPKSW